MQIKWPMHSAGRLLRMCLFISLLLSLASLSLAQDGNYIQTGLDMARDLVEEERGSPLRIARWRYLQEDWSTQAIWQRYGSFGIDSCVAEVIATEKRDILFGWTFTITDVYGKSWQVRISFDLDTAVLCDEVITTAPAKSPAAASAPVNISPGAARVGNFELGGQVTGLTNEAAKRMREAGMTWVKSQLPYSASAAATGKEWIANAHSNGFKILLSVKGDHHQLKENFDGYVNDFAQFLGKLAGFRADAIEVWNEPNLAREWPAGQIHGRNYVKMLAKAYKAIKDANSNTLVISAAPAPTGFAGAAGCTADGKVCNDDVFMQQMAQAGAGQYMDCLGLHYNEGIVSPRANSGDPRPSYPTYYFSSMLNRGASFFPGKPVCWTELGYLSGEGIVNRGPIPTGFAWASNTTVAQQAQWIAEAAALSAQSGRVRMMIVWNINFEKWSGDPQRGYALIRPDGSCPGCATLGAVMRGG